MCWPSGLPQKKNETGQESFLVVREGDDLKKNFSTMSRPPPIMVPRAPEFYQSAPSMIPVISEMRAADRAQFFEPRPSPRAPPVASPLRNDLSHQLAAICIRTSPTRGVGAEEGKADA